MEGYQVQGPVVLLILDGWGIAPDSDSNPISKTDLPTFQRLFEESQQSRLWAHGEYVGLPKDQDGNSEAGHLNLGAGRIVKQDGVVISDAIHDGTFDKNPAFQEAIQHVKRNKSRMHIMGLLSDGQSAHSTPGHLYALLKLMEKEQVSEVYLHIFLDGRDSAPDSGKEMMEELLQKLSPHQKIATIMGRFYGMDRKKKWERTELAYNALVLGAGIRTPDALSLFDRYYAEGVSDEFIEPHVVYEGEHPVATIQDNDSIIFFNHRSDRARQLTKVFTQENFVTANPGTFTPQKILKNVRYVAMTDFGPDLGDILTAYPSVDVDQTLPFVLQNKKQIYIAEAEKYAHTTYFFNGGYADPVGGEQRLMVPSPNVKHYDETPGMSTHQIANHVVKSIETKHDFICANFACLDMVAHTGNFDAAVESLQVVDEELQRIMEAVRQQQGLLLVTADHGNIEEMKDLSSGKVDTEHSKNQVPFLAWGEHVPPVRKQGLLSDVAPTVLDIFGIHKPGKMTGTSLFDLSHESKLS